MKEIDMVEEVVMKRETVTDTQYLVKKYSEETNRYVTVVMYSNAEDALNYARMVKSNRNVFIVARRTVVKEIIADDVVEVVKPR